MTFETMKLFSIVFVLLGTALTVQSRSDIYFEWSFADDHFETQDGMLHLMAKFKDSTVDDFFRQGFNNR